MRTENLGNLVAYLGLNIDGMMAGLMNAKNAMARAGAQMRAIGRSMTMKLTAPILALGGLFVKLAAKFQTSMRKINTMVGLGTDRVNRMSQGVLALSNETGRSAVELSEALFTITSAGQRGAEAMDILERSSKASAIGLGETRAIAKTVTAAMNAYGKENLSAAKATEILLGTVNRGNLLAEELAPVLGRVIGMSSTLGISFAEVGASVATFTRLGVDSAEAVTGLRGIMNSLLKPMDQADEALAKIGTTSEELRNTIAEDGLAATLINLVQGFKGNEEAMADIVPNVRALATIFGTAGVQGDQYIEILEYLKTRTDELDKGFLQISGDSGFQFNKTLQQLKNTGIELGQYLLPIVNTLLTYVKNLIEKFNSFDGSTKALILSIAGLVAAIGPITLLMGVLMTILAGFATPVGIAVAQIAVLVASITWLAYNWDALIERVTDWDWWKKAIIGMNDYMNEKLFGDSWGDEVGKIVENILGDRYADEVDDATDKTEELKTSWVGFGDILKDIGSKVTGLMSKFGVKSTKPPILSQTAREGDIWGNAKPSGENSSTGQGGGLAQYQIGAPDLPDKLSKISTSMLEVENQAEQLGTAVQNSLNTAFVELGETLGELFSGKAKPADLFSGILEALAGFMKAFGSALIAVGVAKVAFENLMLSGWGAIAAGIALVAASAVLKNIGSKGTQPQGLAAGGFVDQGGMFKVHKGEVLSLPHGSAVTKMNDANKSNSGFTNGEFVSMLKGEDVYFMWQEINRKRNNTR